MKIVGICLSLACSVLQLPAVASGQEIALPDRAVMVMWLSAEDSCASDADEIDAWMACGRADAFADILALRGFCLDETDDVWRVGQANQGHDRDLRLWGCLLTAI